MIDLIGRKRNAAGLPQSRLPVFTEAGKTELNGSADFFGVNLYSSEIIRDQLFDDTLVDYTADKDAITYQDKENWYRTWLRITPWGIRRMLNWMKEHYNNPDVIITENGMSDRNGFLDDYENLFLQVLHQQRSLRCSRWGERHWLHSQELDGQLRVGAWLPGTICNALRKLYGSCQASAINYYARLIQKNGFVSEEICDSATVY